MAGKGSPLPTSSTASPSSVYTKGFNYPGSPGLWCVGSILFQKNTFPSPSGLGGSSFSRATGVGLRAKEPLWRWLVSTLSWPACPGRSRIPVWWAWATCSQEALWPWCFLLVLEATEHELAGSLLHRAVPSHESPPASECAALQGQGRGVHLVKSGLFSFFFTSYP